MSDTALERVHWTTADLALLPENGLRYEIVDGDLLVSRQPAWQHQRICGNLYGALTTWSEATGLGQANIVPGIVFSAADNVIPDVVWISQTRLAALLDAAGHLTGAPELVVEVLSPGMENAQRDRETKRKLYAVQGVREYWIVDPAVQTVEIYRRAGATLQRAATLLVDDMLASPLLPGFGCPVARLFR